MRLIITLDARGVEKIELTHASDSEREQAHKLYLALCAEIEKLDAVTKAAAGAADE